MNNNQRERRRSYLAKLTAEFLNSQADGHQSLITVTEFELTPDGRQATAYLAVWPVEKAERALTFAKRQTADWRHFVGPRTKFRPLPRILFRLTPETDYSSAQ